MARPQGTRRGLCRMVDALRGSVDSAEYKHVALGLIFLKCISDAFEEARTKLVSGHRRGVAHLSRWPKLMFTVENGLSLAPSRRVIRRSNSR